VKEVMTIRRAVSNEDFSSFFRLFSKTNYMFACVMLNYFKQMRSSALFQLRPIIKKSITLSFLQQQLMVPDREDLVELLKANGYVKINENDVDLSEVDSNDSQRERLERYRQRNLGFIDARRDLGPNKLKRDYVEKGIYLVDSEQERERVRELRRAEEERKRKQLELQR
jgi:hypothetical protein